MPAFAAWLGAAAIAFVALPAGAQGPDVGEPLGDRESYAFARSVVGEVTVASEGQGVGETVERNQPLLTGDRIRTDRDSRLEIILPDRNRLAVDHETNVGLEQLAFSGDREARITVLRLDSGEILLEVTEEALGDELPRIEGPAATIYIQEPGSYRIAAEGAAWIELVTREGYAEMVTQRGSTIVRTGESAVSGNDSWGRIELSEAGGEDALERWGDALARSADRDSGSAKYVDAPLAYAASDLDDHGDWVVVETARYWRPRVSSGWRPYWDGRWSWTPSGYTWVSNESWGWVPYHYGRWCFLPGYGWAWRPGSTYSPAWVYWHWSNGYAGWCPTGYYTDYYNPWFRGGFRSGSYGWAGGGWGSYSHWNFAPVNCFRNYRDRGFRGHMRRGQDLQRENRWPEAPRGLITTDTRDFRPDRIDRTDQVLQRIRERELRSTRGELPDVTDFVGRQRDLPEPVARAIAPRDANSPRLGIDRPRVASTPGWRQDGVSEGTRSEPRQGSPRLGAPRGGREVAGSPVPPDRGAESSEGTVRRGSPRTGAPATTDSRSGNGDSRQGWRERSGGTPTVSGGRAPAPRRSDPNDGGSYQPDSPRAAEPVGRVVGGTRRSTPRTSEPVDGSGGNSSEAGSSTSAPRTPRSTRGDQPSRPRSTDVYNPGSGDNPVRRRADAPEAGTTPRYDVPRARTADPGSSNGGGTYTPRRVERAPTAAPERPRASAPPEARAESRSRSGSSNSSSASGASGGRSNGGNSSAASGNRSGSRQSSGESGRSSGGRSSSSSSDSKKSDDNRQR